MKRIIFMLTMGVVLSPFCWGRKKSALFIPARCITAVRFTKKCASINGTLAKCDGVIFTLQCVSYSPVKGNEKAKWQIDPMPVRDVLNAIPPQRHMDSAPTSPGQISFADKCELVGDVMQCVQIEKKGESK